MSIGVVLLSYKEEENLKFLIPDIKEEMRKVDEDYQIYVIDSMTPLENTKQLCEKHGVIYINQKYPGFGGAFRTAIESVNTDKFLIMDSDGSHNPSYIPEIYECFVKNNADLVIGSRYAKGGKTNDAKSSVILSRILNFVFRHIIGIKAKDISTDFRLYKTEQLKAVNLKCENYDVLQEVLLKLKLNKSDLIVKEIPIIFYKRKHGKSKRKLLKFTISYLKSIFVFTGMKVRCEQ